MNISTEQLAGVRQLYEQYYLQAYRFAEAIGLLAEWEGIASMQLPGQLANNIGSYSLGRNFFNARPTY